MDLKNQTVQYTGGQNEKKQDCRGEEGSHYCSSLATQKIQNRGQVNLCYCRKEAGLAAEAYKVILGYVGFMLRCGYR